MNDELPTMEVEIDGKIQLRHCCEQWAPEYQIAEAPLHGRTQMPHWAPEIFEGETLVERVGGPPLIIRTNASN